MPVLRVWEADQVIVFKRSMASGYAGVQNPLFFRENSSMLFGDAKQSVDAILQALPGQAQDAPAQPVRQRTTVELTGHPCGRAARCRTRAARPRAPGAAGVRDLRPGPSPLRCATSGRCGRRRCRAPAGRSRPHGPAVSRQRPLGGLVNRWVTASYSHSWPV